MARTTINTQVIPDGTIVSADLSYPLTDFSSTGIDDNATSNALTIDSSGNITVTGTVDGRDLATDGTKLDGIEASADVTDTANVTAAGALMDSEVTNLAQVKAFSSSDYATAAQGTTADSALQNIVEDITPQLGGDLASNGSDILFADSDKAIFGAGSDLQIYHDGSTGSYLDELGTGSLYLRSDGGAINLGTTGGDYFVRAFNGGKVGLYHNALEKLATTSTGIDVTGDVNSDSVTTGTFTSTGIDDNATSTAITIDSSGEVGIGTASPNRALSVVSSEQYVASFTRNNNTAYISLNDSTTTSEAYVGVGAIGNDFAVRAGSGERLRIDNNGNVGIGTTSPANTLHIKNTTSSGAYINYDGQANTEFGLRIESNASGGNFESDFANGTTALLDLYANSATTSGGDLLVARTQSATPVLLVKASGNVGIGTGTPNSPLEVAGTDGATAIGIRGSSTTNNTLGGLIGFGDSANALVSFIGGGRAESNDDGFLSFRTTIAGVTSEAMHIDRSGNVGIGTDSPSTLLEVSDVAGNPAISITADAAGVSDLNLGDENDIDVGRIRYAHAINSMLFSTNATERMRIDSSGNVGIGETNPSGDLHIKDSGGTATLILEGDTLSQLSFGDSADTDIGYIRYTHSTDTMTFITNTTERMRIDSSGSVVLGNTSTSFDFEIYRSGGASQLAITGGNANVSDVLMGDTDDNNIQRIRSDHSDNSLQFQVNNAERMRIDSSGNVGIGTTSPSSVLTAVTSSNANNIQLRRNSSSVNDYAQLGFVISTGTTAANGAEIRAIHTGLPFPGDTEMGFLTKGVGSINERVRITWNGNVVVGTTFPNTAGYVTLTNAGTVVQKNAQFHNGNGSAGSTAPSIYSPASGSLAISANSAERMRIDSSGNLLAGKTSTGFSTDGIELRTGGDGRLYITNDDDACSVFRRNTSNGIISYFYRASTNVGNISVTTTATAYNTSSDVRLKESIVDAPAGNIDAIRVRSFDWKADGSHQTYGMIAQELVDVAPEAVSQGETEDDMWQVDYSKLVPMMIKEIQDLKAEVAALKGA